MSRSHIQIKSCGCVSEIWLAERLSEASSIAVRVAYCEETAAISMKSLRDIAQFRSLKFASVLPDDSQVNPQTYGAELAYWLCMELARRGTVTSYPNAEDWGWFIEFLPSTGSEFAVHCGNVDGKKDLWLLSLRRHARKMFGRDKPPYEEAAGLIAAIHELLTQSPEVGEPQWLYEREFSSGQ